MEPGAAHDDDPAFLLRQRGQHRPAAPLEVGHGEDLFRLDEVDHVVGHPGSLLRGGLGGADVHASVHLHGVHREDVRSQVFRQA